MSSSYEWWDGVKNNKDEEIDSYLKKLFQRAGDHPWMLALQATIREDMVKQLTSKEGDAPLPSEPWTSK